MTAVVAIVVIAALVAVLCLVWMVLAVEQAFQRPSGPLEPPNASGPARLLFGQVVDPGPLGALQRPPQLQVLQVYEHDELSGPSIITTEFQRG